MKKFLAGICVSLSLATAVFTTLPVGALAAEVCATVDGTIAEESNLSLLKLNTSDGLMLIKIDSETDYSACKNLLPGGKVTVSLSYGDDAYMHAVTIKENTKKDSAEVDTNNTSKVYGTIKGAEADTAIITFRTIQGDMKLKLDTSSDISACKILAIGRNYEVIVARGNDAYMHIVSMKDLEGTDYLSLSGSSNNSNSGSSSSSVASIPSTCTANLSSDRVNVSGKVSKDSKIDLLKLNTSSGMMDLKTDALTACNAVLIPDAEVNVVIAYGDDHYWHTISIMRKEQ